VSDPGRPESREGEGAQLAASIRAESSVRADLTTSNIVTFNQPLGGDFDPTRAAQELKERIANHKQERETEKARHDLAEVAKNSEHRRRQETKDNDLRRRAVSGLGLLIVLALVVGTGIATTADNADTRRWGGSQARARGSRPGEAVPAFGDNVGSRLDGAQSSGESDCDPESSR